ncbi:MAG: type II toxin-antitoxin system Phd/YefM family antitoxin [Deltaproteobacteria bacterium]|nr:type II toxin-antitoxin system Phd/YefM family antitoxin [Deltaproteobacteria bacterium]
MRTATAKELRNRTSSILENIQKGREITITLRGKSIAVIKPLLKEEREFKPVGFGMWKDRKDMKNVTEWVAERRKERFPR